MSLLERGRLVAAAGSLAEFLPGGAASPILEQFATHDGGKYYDRSYYAPTPNGHKITLFLEEAELAYRLIRVDIGKGEQFHPQFLAISPNNKVPAIVDHMPADGGAPLSVSSPAPSCSIWRKKR